MSGCAHSAGDHSVRHPLDPATPEEIERATALVRARGGLGPRAWFETIALDEPAKEEVRAFQVGDPIRRRLYVCAYDPDRGETWRGVADLGANALDGWERMPGVQPRITMDEFIELGERVKRDPVFIAALKRRGIDDPDLVLVEPWAAGNFGFAEETGRRVVYTHCWARTRRTDNPYGRPVDGLHALVDADTGEILRLDDTAERGQAIPLAPESGNFRLGAAGALRAPLKPLAITQPEGPSFTVEGYKIAWQGWELRIGFSPREGLILHEVAIRDGARLRSVLTRASLAEMVVSYGSPEEGAFRRNAFDVGEYGVGQFADSLRLGCDCLGHIRYFDAVVHDWHGRPKVIENAICLHEEDFGILHKHSDSYHVEADLKRSRRLVLSFLMTIGNYVYGLYWYFYLDGTIGCEVKLTGIVFSSGLKEGEKPRWGTAVAPGIQAQIHQHVFCFRLDMAVDGERNSISEVNFEGLPIGKGNPHGNAIRTVETILKSERAAQRRISLESARFWKVLNPEVCNRMGEPVAYRLVPGANALPFADSESPIGRRAAFMYQHLWVTPFHPDELYPAGWFPNQHTGGDGLPRWTEADRSIEATDIVLWYTLNYHHLPRPEDWPIQPVAYAGFQFMPSGFFDRNPALDVPPVES